MKYVILVAALGVASGLEFETIYKWKEIDYKFPNQSVREEYLASGEFIPENNMPLGIHGWAEKFFITVPRWKRGVPANLNYFLKNETNSTPTLIPYPDWESNNIDSTDGIVSIFRVRVDACDRLWGVDTGIDDILGNTTAVRPVRIVVIDLKRDKILRIYTLKDSDQKADSFFADLVIDVDPKACDDAYAYISDLSGYGMTIYSWNKNNSWRINHNFFHFDPLNGDYNANGFHFQWTDGVFGMSLSAPREDGYKTLYFHAMSGITEFSVSTKILKDDTLSGAQNYHAFCVEGNKGSSTQGPSSVIDPNTGIDYFTQVNRNGIACWDTTVPLNPNTFVLAGQDNETLVFPNDLYMDTSSNKLYVLSDNLPQLHFSKYDTSKYNFYLTEASLDALAETCKAKSSA